MGILDGKKLVITGVLTDASLAFGVAKIAMEEGAEVVLTGAGRALSLTKRTARKLGESVDVSDMPIACLVDGERRAHADVARIRWRVIQGLPVEDRRDPRALVLPCLHQIPVNAIVEHDSQLAAGALSQ